LACVAVTTTTIETALWSDEFGRASNYLADVEHPVFGDHPRMAALVRFSRSTTQAKPGVLLGSHTDAILSELGKSERQIADLKERKIVS
jgi:crotonobetainyl-CoA:carnitine CoA-transferase CaiB-like acyl-CoA transferase